MDHRPSPLPLRPTLQPLLGFVQQGFYRIVLAFAFPNGASLVEGYRDESSFPVYSTLKPPPLLIKSVK
ncbi:MAG: hypothetical protein PHH11_04815 [Methylomonas sp.]|nr:hypothetical protein [Methylomonas sp.]